MVDICKKYGIINYQIVNGLVNVNGDVNLSNRKLIKLPLRFGHVSGSFNCAYNKLESLEGSPISVGRDFDCYANKLKSLKHGPKIVGWGLYCFHNELISLEGCPITDNGFDCTHNPLPENILKILKHSGLKGVRRYYKLEKI